MKQFIDTETTGLNRNTDDIIQITSIITDDDYNILETYDFKFVSDKVNARCLEIQGLTFETYQLNHIDRFEDKVHELYAILQRTNMEVYAYNQSFDVGMLKSNFERANLPIPQLKGIEVMKKRIKLKNNMLNRGYDLEGVLKFTQAIFPNTRGFHDATYDTVCTLLIARDDKL